ncbi:MAG: DUF418 domain-containing protein [Phenylobacterium sp.]|uniref:DUF418 domain-containing protein n=1 Tax=Phenylobacterium sp. TaxID=1871053 RepID=UPI001A545EC8|nr:DUF418 domain-containing protein [Phenylobacterium sp.]MBL8556942.1 DUF418 domain-containing protein [Phenylobacterium sp.]
MTDTSIAEATRRVAKAERIAALDVLRGFAILAILMMNVPYMGSYADFDLFDPRLVSWTAADQTAFRIIGTLFDGTQRGMLELLFGAGIMIMTRAAMTPDAPVAVADLHLRRNLWLMAFGVFQALVLMWPGDILFPYGIAAIFVFGARTLPARTKAILGVVFLLGVIGSGYARHVDAVNLKAEAVAVQAKVTARKPVTQEQQAKLDKWNDKVKAAAPLAQNKAKQEAVAKEKKARRGPVDGYWKFLAGIWTQFNFSMFALFGMLEIVGTMLLGMALYDWGVLQGRRSAAFYAGLAVAGYGVGATLRTLAIDEMMLFSPDPKTFGWTWDVARMALTLGHVGLFNLILKSAAGSRVLSVFQAPGRMPLTIYLSASILGMLIIFPGFGFGQFGRHGWAGLEAIALSIIAGQLIFANVWMAYFETGPIDWLWKSLAYKKRQPFLKVRGPMGVAAPAAAE